MQVDRGVLNALVQNGGAILADGGRVMVTSIRQTALPKKSQFASNFSNSHAGIGFE